jgi:hypothetical protein
LVLNLFVAHYLNRSLDRSMLLLCNYAVLHRVLRLVIPADKILAIYVRKAQLGMQGFFFFFAISTYLFIFHYRTWKMLAADWIYVTYLCEVGLTFDLGYGHRETFSIKLILGFRLLCKCGSISFPNFACFRNLCKQDSMIAVPTVVRHNLVHISWTFHAVAKHG